MENTKLVKMGTWQEKKEERGAMTDSKALKHANTEDWLSLPNLVEGEENVRDSCLVIDNEEEVLISKPVARFSTEQNVEDSQFKMKHRPTEPQKKETAVQKLSSSSSDSSSDSMNDRQRPSSIKKMMLEVEQDLTQTKKHISHNSFLAVKTPEELKDE